MKKFFWFVVLLLITCLLFAEGNREKTTAETATAYPPTRFYEATKPDPQPGDDTEAITTIGRMRLALWYKDQYDSLLLFTDDMMEMYMDLYQNYVAVRNEAFRLIERAERYEIVAKIAIGSTAALALIEVAQIIFLIVSR